MSNSYFQFKQFTVHQQLAAMKVCTDACVFGAWVAQKAQQTECRLMLDIGTGTGLLSLMLAQKTMAIVDAIDIDEQACLQATANFASSPWQERLHALQADARTYNLGKQYDLIITNPPFYEKELKSPDNSANLARHDTGLTTEALIKCIRNSLSRSGLCAVMLPATRFLRFEEQAEQHDLFPVSRLDVRQTNNHSVFRTMALFGRERVGETASFEISIKAGDKYTPEFISLLQDYYLNL